MAIKQGPSAREARFILSAPRCPEIHASGEECAFRVAWCINPHMRVGAVQPHHAVRQHARFCRALRQAGAALEFLPFVHGAYDSVFAKDSAVLQERDGQRRALLSSPRHPERQREQAARAAALEALDFALEPPLACCLEGGDVVVGPPGGAVFLGHGFRSDAGAAKGLERFLGSPVLPLQLVDPHLYHLDTALHVLADGTALVCREAFTPGSLRVIERAPGIGRVVPVDRAGALAFGLNLVEVGQQVILASSAPRVAFLLRSLGREPRVVALDGFQHAGGSAACLVARVHQAGSVANIPTAAIRSTPAPA